MVLSVTLMISDIYSADLEITTLKISVGTHLSKNFFFFNLLKHLKSKRVWTMVIHKWEWLQHLVYHDGSQGVVYSIYNSISWKADTDVNYHAVFYWFVCTDNELLEGITITCVYKPSRYFSDSWSLKEPLFWWTGRK